MAAMGIEGRTLRLEGKPQFLGAEHRRKMANFVIR
jgi:hypothetical protein